jgi:hypothetical protein
LTTGYYPKFRITGTTVTAPSLTGVSPSTGSTAGGTVVTITGTGLTGASALTFAGTPATAFTVDSATQITATTPPNTAGAADVAVTTPGGMAAIAGSFTYEAPAQGDSAVGAGPGATAPTEARRPGPNAARIGTPPPFRRAGRMTIHTDRVRVVEPGRYSIFYEAADGRRVPMARASQIGDRGLARTTYAAVVELPGGAELALRSRLNLAGRNGLVLRIIRREASGALTGDNFRAG